MANICCDDVYFYSDTNSKGLLALWEDLETSIVFCPDADLAWIGNLFQKKGISAEGISLRGTVSYLERNDDNILLSMEAAWTPLYDAYKAIAKTYQISFVMQSVESGEGIYINTDTTGRFFPEKYTISFPEESFVTPSGIPIGEKLECGELFFSADTLLKRLGYLGYAADSTEALENILEDDDIYIHKFENPYDTERKEGKAYV